MTLMIEAEVSDKNVADLKKMGYDICSPFSANIILDYGDKVIYCNSRPGTIIEKDEWAGEYNDKLF